MPSQTPFYRRGLLLLLALLLPTAPLAAQSAQDLAEMAQAAKNPTHKAHALPAVGNDKDGYPPLTIGPGDLLDISVYGDNEVPLQYQVDSDGAIVFPYIGKVKLTGLTPSQAASRIASLSGKLHNVSVVVEESNTFFVSVLGLVAHPGNYQIRGVPTALSLLAEAGGDLPQADLSQANVLRNGKRLPLRLDRYLNGNADLTQQPLLYPGDTLVLPKQGFPSAPGDFAVIAGIIASLAVATYYLHQDNILRF